MKEETLSEPEQISGLKLLSATIRYSPHFAVIWDGGQNDKPLLVFTTCALKRDSYTGLVQHQHHVVQHQQVCSGIDSSNGGINWGISLLCKGPTNYCLLIGQDVEMVIMNDY